MVEDLFTNQHSNLPQHVQDNFDEDEVWILNDSKSFEERCSWTFDEFFSFVKARVVFITPDTAIAVSCDTPSHLNYTIDTTFAFPTKNVQKTFHIAGVDANATSAAANFLLHFVVESTKENRNIGVVFKCFPTTPRQELCPLDLSFTKSNVDRKRKISAVTQSSSKCGTNVNVDIEFRFLALKRSHVEAIFNQNTDVVSCVKFSQCEVEEWATRDENGSDQISYGHPVLPPKLVLSCTQAEFRKFSKGRLLASKTTTIRELHLVLHFMLTDLDVEFLISTIENNQSLEHLRIEYLDLDDNTWASICKSLYAHPKLKFLHIAYTEKFTDSYRRLTPERRNTRTKDVLELVETNKVLQEIHWPKFQQDESLIPRVEQLLTENKRSDK